ncbi:MAG: HAD-IC family P-type ATPase [Propionibacteriaceae bacterium]|nr:HAD-IC family P-type ATPase [Propionibacteriaceae bacterium]
MAAAAISVAAVAFTGWFIAGGPVSAAWSAAVAVLIVACPAALTLAAPLAYAVGWRRAAPLGLRVSSPATLALAGRVDTVVLDRSGALTTGHLDLTGVYPLEGLDEAALLRVGGALASQASTPLARAVTQAALARGLVLPRATEVVSIRNRGVSATVEDHQAYVGRLPWAAAQTTQPITPALAECYADAVARGRTAIAFVWDGRFQGIVEIGNPLRPTSAAAVAAFRRLGLDLMIVTRADQATARYTAELLGVSEFAAELTDTCKADIVRKRQAAGRIVAMVSDGVDSAPALAQADLAITLANPAAAASGAGLALLRDDLLAAADAIRLARRTAVCARGNLTWAVACHIAILPAAFGLVSPVLAAAVAALTVAGTIVNSLRLRAFRASGHPKAPQTATA